MIEEFDEDIMNAAGQIDSFFEEKYDALISEWEEIKRFVAESKEKKGNPQVKAKWQKYMQKYLVKIMECNYVDPEYRYYKTILDFLGVDPYLYEAILDDINKKNKRVKCCSLF